MSLKKSEIFAAKVHFLVEKTSVIDSNGGRHIWSVDQITVLKDLRCGLCAFDFELDILQLQVSYY